MNRRRFVLTTSLALLGTLTLGSGVTPLSNPQIISEIRAEERKKIDHVLEALKDFAYTRYDLSIAKAEAIDLQIKILENENSIHASSLEGSMVEKHNEVGSLEKEVKEKRDLLSRIEGFSLLSMPFAPNSLNDDFEKYGLAYFVAKPVIGGLSNEDIAKYQHQGKIGKLHLEKMKILNNTPSYLVGKIIENTHNGQVVVVETSVDDFEGIEPFDNYYKSKTGQGQNIAFLAAYGRIYENKTAVYSLAEREFEKWKNNAHKNNDCSLEENLMHRLLQKWHFSALNSKDYKQAFIANAINEYENVKIAHEFQHIADLKLPIRMDIVELEFRGLMAEFEVNPLMAVVDALKYEQYSFPYNKVAERFFDKFNKEDLMRRYCSNN